MHAAVTGALLDVRVARGDAGIVMPRHHSFQVLQRGLHVSVEAAAQFILAVSLPRDCFERFLVPEHGGVPRFWTNGLDGKGCIEDAFQLFDSAESAQQASCRWAWRGARVYRIELDEQARAAWLEVVSEAGEPW